MSKRFLPPIRVATWAKGLAIYGNGRLWQEVGLEAARSRWAEIAAAVVFLWLLGLLGLSFVLLHLNLDFTLPQGILAPARGMQTTLALADPPTDPAALGPWGLGAIGLGAWLCLVAGTDKLLRLVAVVSSRGTTRTKTWRSRLLPWGVTLLGLGLLGVTFTLLGHAEAGGQAIPIRWLGLLGRWALTLGMTALGLGLVYRLTPPRWAPGLPLWPGVRMSLGLGLGLLGLRHWGTSWLTRQDIAYGLLLGLGINLVALYGLILLVPMGAQINLSAIRHRDSSRAWGLSPPATPPPSFDSFKINRRN